MSTPKYIGGDRELSTTGFTAKGQSVDPAVVTRNVLRQIDPALDSFGITVWSMNQDPFRPEDYASTIYRDHLRHWTSTGQCYYPDMSHVEACTASCLDPTTFAAQAISTLLVAEEARKRAQHEAAPEVTYALSTGNVDALDPAISYGTHVNVSIDSSLWENLFLDPRQPGILGFVASAIAAAIPFFGAGYLLPLKGGSTVFSLSARAHHLSRMTTLSTTEPFQRGLLNRRREPHGAGQDRLHLIGFDFAVLSDALLSSFLQCVLSAAEEGFCGLNLFHPIQALRKWSWNLDLKTGRLPATAMLLDGSKITLPQYIRQLGARLLEMCEAGLITDRIAPRAKEMLPRILELARYAEEGSILHCARHLTWASKLMYLMQLSREEGVLWGDATTRLADHDYCSTDPGRGVFWSLWEKGMVDPLVARSDVEAALDSGPCESRDWGRGQLIRRFHREITDLDWSYVELRLNDQRWGERLRIDLPNLDSLNRPAFSRVLEEATDVSHLEQLFKQEANPAARTTDPITDIRSQIAMDSSSATTDRFIEN